MEKFKNYRDYLKSQHEQVGKDLDAVCATPKTDMKWGQEGMLGKLSDALGLYLSTEPDKRRDQVIELGFSARMTGMVNFNGPSKIVSYGVVESLNTEDENTIHTFAQNLKDKFDDLLK